MRVIICGAGRVGSNIAAYLSRESNEVTIIDSDERTIARINNDLDVNGIVGQGSNPDILARAGAAEADILIAVTHFDEVNMVACQIAHSLFNIPRKIARIREKAYLDPAWANLFTRAHMPIDVTISPEAEVSRAVNLRLSVPGTTNVIPLAGGRLYMLGVLCDSGCPLLNTPLRQIEALFPRLSMKIVALVRGTDGMLPGPDDQLRAGDEVYFCVDARHMQRALAAFGHEEKKARGIVVLGGGNIGHGVIDLLRRQHADIRIKLIERNAARAAWLGEQFEDIIVLQGDAINGEILREAGIAGAETLVALTDDDETNILGSLLAKQHGCPRVITLVNNPAYSSLVGTLGIDAVVSPRAITVSAIMQHVRRGRIKALQTLRDGFAEIIEAEASDMCSIANLPLSQIPLPPQTVICAIARNDEVHMPTPGLVVRPGDHVVILSVQEQARNAEKLFSVHVDLF